MHEFYRISCYLDAPKRYYGSTLAEISTIVVLFFCSMLVDEMALGFFASVIGFKLVRTLSRSPQFILWKRWMHFRGMELIYGSKGRFFL